MLHPLPALLLTAALTAQAPTLFGEARKAHLPDVRLIGARLADLDGDRDLDVLAQTDAGLRTWLNLGEFRFVDTSALALPGQDYAAVAVFDADRDGDLDVLAYGLTLLRNRGGGSFVAEPSTRILARDIVTGDLDGDGDVDVVARDLTTPVVWLLGNDGQGHFQTYAAITAFTLQPGMVLADFDGDNDLDLAMLGSAPQLYRNDGHGGFGAPASLPRDLSAPLAVDVDRDGDVDILGNGVLINDGHGNFTDETAQRLPTTAANWHSVTAVDFDGDGDVDLIAGIDDDVERASNDGHGRFTAVPAGELRRVREHLFVAGDLDGNGTPDLVAAGYLFTGRADGTFALIDAPAIGAGTAVVGNADFDGDGDVDLLGRDLAHGVTYAVLHNDGSANFARGAAATLAAQVPLAVREAVGDLDGDGDIDVLASLGGPVHRLFAVPNSGGQLGAAVASPFTSPGAPIDLYLGDVDADGDLDALDVGSLGAVVAANDGHGGFPAGTTVWPGPVVAGDYADVDGDGRRDLLLANDTLTLLANRGGAFVDVTAQWFAAVPSGFGKPRVLEQAGSTWLLWSRDGAVDVYERGVGGFALRPALGASFVGSVAAARVVEVLPGVRYLALTVNAAGRAQARLFAFDASRGLQDATGAVAADNRYASIAGGTDLDGDGDSDLLGEVSSTDFRVLRGQTRSLRVPFTGLLGGTLTLTLRDTAATGSGPVAVVLAFGAPTRLPLGALGVLRVEPRTAVVSAPLRLVAADELSVPVRVPADPVLRDVAFSVQAVHVGPAGAVRLGPVVRETLR